MATKYATKGGTKAVQNYFVAKFGKINTYEILTQKKVNLGMITVDSKDAIRKISDVTRKLSFEQFRVANARAINHTLAKAKTAANRSVRDLYKIPQQQVSKGIHIGKATKTTPYGVLKVNSAFTPLHAFQPTQTSSTGVRSVVTKSGALASKAKRVKRVRTTDMKLEIIRGKKTAIPSAFFLPGSSKGVVMGRGKYSGERKFIWRNRRVQPRGNDTPIESLRTVSVYAGVVNPTSQTKIFNQVGEDFRNRLIHEASRLIP